MVANMKEINEDANVLRVGIDGLAADLTVSGYADSQIRSMYNAVTRLHELAASAIRANVPVIDNRTGQVVVRGVVQSGREGDWHRDVKSVNSILPGGP